ncbi:MAG: ABC transporter ATP-binding protein [Deltaproteobacteria bacterium]|nr:MAG: ABC transporter ATP-binding protein [Deltaproteobacteria bacterium]
MLKVEGVTKSFGGLTVLRDLTFAVKEGEIVGIIGPNGAGKTTLFNIITGFLRPNEGRVVFRGRRIDGLRPNRIVKLGVARTFQLVRPLADLSVEENVRASCLFGREPRRAGEGRVQEILDLFGLGKKADVPARNLSLPEKKKLEFARALATSPVLLLLDEVMAGLLPREVEGMLETVRRVKDKEKLTIVVVEHNMHVIHALCERIIVLNFGEKIFEGPPDEATRDRGVIEAYLGV